MNTQKGELLIYRSEDGEIKLEVKLENESLWLSQQMMAELFQTSKQNITIHLKNIYSEGELDKASACKDFFTVRQEGARKVQRTVTHYNLDAIISVGYRVKSLIATRFRIWATQQLNTFLFQSNRKAS